MNLTRADATTAPRVGHQQHVCRTTARVQDNCICKYVEPKLRPPSLSHPTILPLLDASLTLECCSTIQCSQTFTLWAKQNRFVTRFFGHLQRPMIVLVVFILIATNDIQYNSPHMSVIYNTQLLSLLYKTLNLTLYLMYIHITL